MEDKTWGFSASNASSSLNFTLPPNFGKRPTDLALSIILVVMLFIVMISLGCTLEFSKMKAHFWKPKGIAIALVSQYGVMPLTAFALGKIFQLNNIEALAILICGCSPGGTLSNIFSLALKGDMNLSIVMTTCSTFFALALMPFLLYIYSKGIYEGDLKDKVPYGHIAISLALILIPCTIGIIINSKKPQYGRYIVKGGMVIMLISSVAIAALSAINVGRSIMFVMTYHLLATSALMPFTGFTLGYILSAILRLNGRCRRTVSMETGCQNVQLCSAILNVAFPPEVIGPLFFFPLLYMIFQLAEGLLFIAIFKCYNKIRTSKGGSHSWLLLQSRCRQLTIPSLSSVKSACKPFFSPVPWLHRVTATTTTSGEKGQHPELQSIQTEVSRQRNISAHWGNQILNKRGENFTRNRG